MRDGEIVREVVDWPRRAGKQAAMEQLLEDAVLLGKHVHRGRECVTGECEEQRRG